MNGKLHWYYLKEGDKLTT